MAETSSPVLLFDGSCGLCTRVVQRVLRADQRGTLRFASLQGEYAGEVFSRHPLLNGVDSMAWVEPTSNAKGERVFIRSEAVLHLAYYLGFPWRAVTLARWVPLGVRDRLYDWVAKRRRRWFLDAPTCSIGTAEYRDRMIGA